MQKYIQSFILSHVLCAPSRMQVPSLSFYLASSFQILKPHQTGRMDFVERSTLSLSLPNKFRSFLAASECKYNYTNYFSLLINVFATIPNSVAGQHNENECVRFSLPPGIPTFNSSVLIAYVVVNELVNLCLIRDSSNKLVNLKRWKKKLQDILKFFQHIQTLSTNRRPPAVPCC